MNNVEWEGTRVMHEIVRRLDVMDLDEQDWAANTHNR